MDRRPSDWVFGPIHHHSETTARWYTRHTSTVDRWLSELEAADDPWLQSAEHAAFCLVSCSEFETQGRPTWDVFDVGDFLFSDLWEGGTVGMVGPVDVFFDHLVEGLRRFVVDGLIEEERGAAWLAQMRARRDDFLRCYSEETSGEESRAIARRHTRDWPFARQAAAERAVAKPVVTRKVGRNAACPCGSGKKYKRCCSRRR